MGARLRARMFIGSTEPNTSQRLIICGRSDGGNERPVFCERSTLDTVDEIGSLAEPRCQAQGPPCRPPLAGAFLDRPVQLKGQISCHTDTSDLRIDTVNAALAEM
jgi:hypothetical protein